MLELKRQVAAKKVEIDELGKNLHNKEEILHRWKLFSPIVWENSYFFLFFGFRAMKYFKEKFFYAII